MVFLKEGSTYFTPCRRFKGYHRLNFWKIQVGYSSSFSLEDILHLSHWKKRILELKDSFALISFSHIFIELITVAHALSKETVGLMEGIIHFEEIAVHHECYGFMYTVNTIDEGLAFHG